MLIDLENRKLLRLVCIAILFGYLVAGLWPFNFAPENRASLLNGAISFSPPSVAWTARPVDFANSRAITIELLLEPQYVTSQENRRILALHDGTLPENLLLAQWKSELLLRARFAGAAAGRLQYREFRVATALRPGARLWVAITSDAAGTSVYLEGILAERYPNLILRPEMLRGRFVLGDTPQGNRGWAGKLYGLAIYGRSLTSAEVRRDCDLWTRGNPHALLGARGLAVLYFFDQTGTREVGDHSPARNSLVIPATSRPLQRPVLQSLWKNSYNPMDLAINVAGFVPFGFFYFLYRKRNLFWTLLAAALISLTIELLQVYLPTRASQTTDLVTNIAGALLGALAAKKLTARMRTHKDAKV